MEKPNQLRRMGIHALVILLFVALAYGYMFPLLEGKTLVTHDIQSHAGMAKELIDYREANGREAIWTNAMFGGMPGYMISVVYSYNLLTRIQSAVLSLLHPASMLILFMAGFYILLNAFRISRWLSVIGAIAFGFSSYHLIIISAGHNSKAYAIGYLMIVLAGVIYAYRINLWKGGLLFALGLSLEIMAGHPQITYYGLLALLVFGISELTYAWKEKILSQFLKTTLVLFVGAIVAIMVNFSYLYTSYEYAKDTIRGPSELSANSENRTTGLDKSYVVQWSQGIDETLTFLIPNFKGGSHTTDPGVNSESFEALARFGVENPRQIIKQVIMYHGDKPFTSGPYYAGAIILFLFVLGLFLVKGPDKWWLLGATVLSVVLSWGKYVMPITNFLLDYLPLYNKFRAPEMTLIIAGFTLPLLGIIALQQIFSGKTENRQLQKALVWAFGLTGGIALLFALLPGLAGSFSAPFDGAYPDWLADAVENDRRTFLRNDALRSFFFISLAASALVLWQSKKLKTNLVWGFLGVLILADLWMVDKRYLNNDNFSSRREAAAHYQPTTADLEILKDTDKSYRVLPLQNPWSDSRASYFHQNVGGYHAAKLRRYQEMIEFHFSPEIEQMVEALQTQASDFEVFAPLRTLNMMNTRYIIYDLNSPPLINRFALGNAWMVNSYEIVPNADAELEGLSKIDPAQTAVIDRRFSDLLDGFRPDFDPTATISLTDYKPNNLTYNYRAETSQLAIFSEIYYPKGWNAYIDGKPVPHFRANYILRAMVLPAGEGTIEFKFNPSSFKLGNAISLGGSILLLLLITAFVFLEMLKKPQTGSDG